MQVRSKRLWVVTLANVAVASLVLFVIYSVMLLLAALAPVISEWPLYVLLTIGLALSIAGLAFAKDAVSRIPRLITLIVNGSVLAFDLLIIIGLATIFFSSRRERFLIPDGY